MCVCLARLKPVTSAGSWPRNKGCILHRKRKNQIFFFFNSSWSRSEPMPGPSAPPSLQDQTWSRPLFSQCGSSYRRVKCVLGGRLRWEAFVSARTGEIWNRFKFGQKSILCYLSNTVLPEKKGKKNCFLITTSCEVRASFSTFVWKTHSRLQTINKCKKKGEILMPKLRLMFIQTYKEVWADDITHTHTHIRVRIFLTDH